MNNDTTPDDTVVDHTGREHSLLAPNHHAGFRGLSGIAGWLAARSMSSGRTDAAELAISLTDLRPGDHVVDIGCGPGVAARMAAGRGAIVTAVDPTPVMLRTARKADRTRAVTWRRSGAESLPLSDRTQDIAWALSTVHHWPDLDSALAEVIRVLVPGGRFLAGERRTEPGATGLASHGWTLSQADTFADMCRSAGLRDVDLSAHPTSRGDLLVVRAHAAT
jgi:ubiquinone/menaquinone biosynthesis C-methylase UbiE